MKQHDYRNEVHSTLDVSSHLGHTLHIMTTNAYGARVLNLRMHRDVPSKTGHTGYTKVGMFLTKEEAKKLRDTLTDLIEKDDAWLVDGGEWIEAQDD